MSLSANDFSNEDITVTYKPSCCINAGLCAKQLSTVFRNSVIPCVGFPKNRTVNNSNLLTLNSNCHNEKQQI